MGAEEPLPAGQLAIGEEYGSCQDTVGLKSIMQIKIDEYVHSVFDGLVKLSDNETIIIRETEYFKVR